MYKMSKKIGRVGIGCNIPGNYIIGTLDIYYKVKRHYFSPELIKDYKVVEVKGV